MRVGVVGCGGVVVCGDGVVYVEVVVHRTEGKSALVLSLMNREDERGGNVVDGIYRWDRWNRREKRTSCRIWTIVGVAPFSHPYLPIRIPQYTHPPTYPIQSQTMFLTLDHRIAFIHIPKTAGETIYRILGKAFESGMVRHPNGTRQWHDSAYLSFWGQDKQRGIDATHLYQDILYEYVGQVLYESCVSFAVIRDPYDRFYSAFADIPSKVHYSRDIAKNAEPLWVHKYPEYTAVTKPDTPEARSNAFRTFCTLVDTHNIVHDTITKHNIHLVPQHRFVYRNGTRNVTELIRFDRLHIDLVNLVVKLCRQRGMDKWTNTLYRVPVSRQPSRTTSTSKSKSTRSRRQTRRQTRRRSGGFGGGRARARGRGHKPKPKPKAYHSPNPSFPRDTERGLATLPIRIHAAFHTETSIAKRVEGSKAKAFTEDALQLVERLYAEDFKRFGFRKRSVLARTGKQTV